MSDTYLTNLLNRCQTPAREPAPHYNDEGEFALWHISEDPDLEIFEPHVPVTNPTASPAVWAIDTRHQPMFWFPRDCPRVCFWPVSTTTEADRKRLFGETTGRRHVMPFDWWEQFVSATLYAYQFDPEGFEPHEEVGGYWTSTETVRAVRRVALTKLGKLHEDAEIELTAVENFQEIWDSVRTSTAEFSAIRL